MERDLSTGDFIGAAADLISKRLRETLLYVLVVGGLTAAGVWFDLADRSGYSFGFGFMITTDNGLATALFQLAASIVSVVGGYLLLTQFLAQQGRSSESEGRFWHYLGMWILSTIALVFGLLLLIVPGLILLVRWSAASGFLIDAKEGVIDALSASWHATRGHGWAIFFAGLAIAIGLSILGGILGLTGVLLGASFAGVVSAFFEAFSGAVFLALGIGIYGLVHKGSRELDEVFA